MKKVTLDPTKIEYDGYGFKVVISEEELMKKFKELQRKISEDLGESEDETEDE